MKVAMKVGFVLSASTGIACLLTACSAVPFVPPQPRPTDSAVATQRLQCSADPAGDEQRLDQVIQQTTVIKSQPLYSMVNSKDVPLSSRVNGAAIVVQPPNGVTTAELTSLLRCHAARAVLTKGNASTFASDPFYLAGSWVDIDVREVQGSYAITIGAKSVHDGLEVVRNANGFALAHGGRVDDNCVAWATTKSESTCVARASAVAPQPPQPVIYSP
jgi:hypothetical protein